MALSFSLSHGRLEVSGVLTARAEALLSDGTLLTSDDGSGALEWQTRALGDAIEIRLSLRNRSTTSPLRVEQLRPLVALEGPRGLAPGALLVGQTGWQSWSRAHPPLPFAPDAASQPAPIRNPILPHRRPDSQVVPWMALLQPAADEDALLVGFISAHRQTGLVELWEEGGRVILRAAVEAEGTRVGPGEVLASEPLVLMVGDPRQLRARYATLVADRMGARVSNGIPSGWCTWYQFFTRVTEADVRRNLEALAARRFQLPLEIVQVDDGYQRQVGDWLALKDTFPGGMRPLTDAIRARGFTPGLWLAPFLLSARSWTYADHPDWVVRDEHGAPVPALDNWGAANYALDTTHPDALAWLERVIGTVCEEWGYDYLKLDFLYAASLRGQRHDPTATSLEAYRRGLQRIRDVAGERFLLGCGAPLLPSIGLVDGMRIGSDVAPYWRKGSEPGPSLANALRATLARGWMHGRWWANDPDCVLARGHDTELTESEVQAWAGVVALSGGMVMAGDDLAALEEDRVRLLSRLLPPLGEPAETGAPFADDAPRHLRLPVRRDWGEWLVVGLGNWSDEPCAIQFDPAGWGLGATSYHLVDLWTGEHRGPLDGAADLGTLEPHALRLLSVHPVRPHPWVVGSTGHLLGDAMDLASVEWVAAERTLRVSLADGRHHVGEVLAYVPEGYRSDSGSRLVRIPFNPEHPRTIELRLATDAA